MIEWTQETINSAGIVVIAVVLLWHVVVDGGRWKEVSQLMNSIRKTLDELEAKAKK
jgi:hypothetical protein